MSKSETIEFKFDSIIKYVEEKYPLSHERDIVIKRSEIDKLKIYQRDIDKLMSKGYIEKVKQGWYKVVYGENERSEASLIAALFPDGVLCMNTALFYYGYSDRTPLDWDIAIDRNASKAKFKLDYPYVKPYFMENKHLNYGVTEGIYEDCTLHIFDRDRLICECIHNENKMDKETYNKAIQAYISDPKKCIANLIEYAKKRNNLKKVKERIGVWL